MGGVINLIKKIFGGIFSLIGGILGGKSSGGYYMEAEEAPKAAPASSEAPKAAKSEPVAAPAAAAKSVEPAKTVMADMNGSMNGSKPPVSTNTLNLPQPTVSVASAAPALTTPRRRPGANMTTFLEMAKTVKTPSN